LIFALWANIHIQFVMGLGIVGIALLFPGKTARWIWGLLLIGVVAAVLLNPYGAGVYKVILEYLSQKAPQTLIAEMGPPEVQKVWTWATFGLLVAAGVVWWRTRPRDGFYLALLISGLVFSLRSQRDLWFGILSALAILKSVGPVQPGFRRGLFALVMMLFVVLRLVPGERPSHLAQSEKFPVAAVNWLNQHLPRGPIFNDFDWGGYLTWHLRPYPVSIDGRANLYGDERLFQSFRSWNEPGAAAADPDFVSANIVLARADTALAAELRQNPEWTVAFEDATAIVFTRKIPR
ncbi:MAG: hypothetical protein ACRCZF_23145, partial [Gemmataceae bacterium]